MPIPVVVSPAMLEIYNGSLHTAMSGSEGPLSNLPKLSRDALIGFTGWAVFGKSFILGASASGDKADRRKMQLIGFTSKAINLGVTMPIGYVKRLNTRYNPNGADEATEYHSIVVETESNEATAEVARRVEEMGFELSDRFENAQRASLLILLITLVFNLISVIILTVAAVNIMHTFLMIILERRRELGLDARAGRHKGHHPPHRPGRGDVLGAGRRRRRRGRRLGGHADHRRPLRSQVGDFPFKPESLFVFEPWMFVCRHGSSAAVLLDRRALARAARQPHRPRRGLTGR